MTVTVCNGSSFGDEGKGRIIDYIVSKHRCDNLVIRYAGGGNAGHTVINDHGKFVLHLIPSGVFNKNSTCLLGPGTVIDPDKFSQELIDLSINNGNVDVSRVFISARAHIVMPYHMRLDGLEESMRFGKDHIGTTKRGIGPCYSDKFARIGIRFGDLYSKDLEKKIRKSVERANIILSYYRQMPISAVGMMDKCLAWKEHFKDMVIDDYPLVQHYLRKNLPITLEGQLGIMKGINFGTYPIVTSSNPACDMCSGSGIAPTKIDEIIGVTKTYNTIVGGGAFPTKLKNEKLAAKIGKKGKEYGATTGRERGIGWLDLPVLRYAVEIGGITKLAVVKTDIVTKDIVDKIKVCVAYKVYNRNGQVEITDMLPDPALLEECFIEPVYKEFNSWSEHWASPEDTRVPNNLKKYLDFISAFVNCPIGYVSFGPERSELIEL